VALIVGGHDRGIDYAPLAMGLRDRPAPTLVLTLPDSGPRIHAELEAAATPAGAGASSAVAGIVDCADLDAAVTRAFDWARPDGVVLLSPAAPSFGHFRDYRDRGEAFTRAVATCHSR
jgi:UDP-N-acetylmuramoyl-L-alanine---L-glutamate ligase